MKTFIDYIEESCSGIKDSRILYKYKRKMIDEITERANEIISSGLKDEKVLYDIIADEYSDLKGGYERFEKEEKKKKRDSINRKLIAIGSSVFFVLTFVVYFSLSSLTNRWDITWLIIVGGIFALVIYLLSFLIKRLCRMRKFLQPVARLLTAGCIMMATVFAFLCCLMLTDMHNSWAVVLMGIIVMFITDGIFAKKTKQKFAIINYFLYIPASAAMLYVILASFRAVSWGTGWLIVLLGVLADFVIAAGIIVDNAKYSLMFKEEDED